jgi:hypothetical protein
MVFAIASNSLRKTLLLLGTSTGLNAHQYSEPSPTDFRIQVLNDSFARCAIKNLKFKSTTISSAITGSPVPQLVAICRS